MKSYGVKPDELLAWQRLLPAQKQMFAELLQFYELTFVAALRWMFRNA